MVLTAIEIGKLTILAGVVTVFTAVTIMAVHRLLYNNFWRWLFNIRTEQKSKYRPKYQGGKEVYYD